MNKTEEFIKPKTTFGDTLRFTPYAWAKLIWMRDRGNTEVAGYGITRTEDPLLVTDFVLVKQECTTVTFDLDPKDGVEYVERMMDQGIPPWACQNILIHTHPGDCPSPSGTDENNFKSAFSHPNWAIMFIIAEGGSCYCRLKINIGPGSINELKVGINWKINFDGTDTDAWEDEYKAKVSEILPGIKMTGKEIIDSHFPKSEDGLYRDIKDPLWWNDKEDKWGLLSEAEDAELDLLIKETDEVYTDIDLDCHWDCNGNVAYWYEKTNRWFFFNPVSNSWWAEPEKKGGAVEEIDWREEEWMKKIEDWALQFSDERIIAVES